MCKIYMNVDIEGLNPVCEVIEYDGLHYKKGE